MIVPNSIRRYGNQYVIDVDGNTLIVDNVPLEPCELVELQQNGINGNMVSLNELTHFYNL